MSKILVFFAALAILGTLNVVPLLVSGAWLITALVVPLAVLASWLVQKAEHHRSRVDADLAKHSRSIQLHGAIAFDAGSELAQGLFWGKGNRNFAFVASYAMLILVAIWGPWYGWWWLMFAFIVVIYIILTVILLSLWEYPIQG